MLMGRWERGTAIVPSIFVLCCLLRFLLEELGNNLVNNLIDQSANFIWCFGLDRVRDKNRLVLRQS